MRAPAAPWSIRPVARSAPTEVNEDANQSRHSRTAPDAPVAQPAAGRATTNKNSRTTQRAAHPTRTRRHASTCTVSQLHSCTRACTKTHCMQLSDATHTSPDPMPNGRPTHANDTATRNRQTPRPPCGEHLSPRNKRLQVMPPTRNPDRASIAISRRLNAATRHAPHHNHPRLNAGPPIHYPRVGNSTSRARAGARSWHLPRWKSKSTRCDLHPTPLNIPPIASARAPPQRRRRHAATTRRSRRSNK